MKTQQCVCVYVSVYVSVCLVCVWVCVQQTNLGLILRNLRKIHYTRDLMNLLSLTATQIKPQEINIHSLVKRSTL